MTREGNLILGIAEVNGGINYYGNRPAYMPAGGTRLVARQRERNSQGRTGPRHSLGEELGCVAGDRVLVMVTAQHETQPSPLSAWPAPMGVRRLLRQC